MSEIESTEPTAEDYQEWYNEWLRTYEIEEWLDNTEENWTKVQKMDPRYVWTSHSTCEDEMVTNGARMLKGSCCWDTFGWHVGKKPWEGDIEDTYISEKASAYLSCTTCNLDGEGEDIEPECLECEGEGYVNHYFD